MKSLESILGFLVHFVLDQCVSLKSELVTGQDECGYLEETGSAIEIQVKILDLAEL